MIPDGPNSRRSCADDSATSGKQANRVAQSSAWTWVARQAARCARIRPPWPAMSSARQGVPRSV